MPTDLASLRALRAAGSMPLWLQLKHALRDLITFDLKPGDRMPSEADLCDHYSLSRITVRQAITALVDEGFVARQRGRGSFVRAARLSEPLTDTAHFLLAGFDAAAPERVTLYSSQTVPAPEWIAARLRLAPGDMVHKMRKVLTQDDGQPVAYRTAYVPAALVPRLPEADLAAPLVLVLEQVFGMPADTADETIEFIVADPFRAEMLGVPENHPLILLERTVLLEDGRALECSRTFYRADRFRFRRQLVR